MSNNLFKAMCFLLLAVILVVAKALKLSVFTNGMTLIFAIAMVVLSGVFFIKYRKE